MEFLRYSPDEDEELGAAHKQDGKKALPYDFLAQKKLASTTYYPGLSAKEVFFKQKTETPFLFILIN